MRNDLISRSEAEKLLREYADYVGCNRGEYELANGILKAACYIRDNIPTAYDVDNVVEQLEEKTELAYKRYIDCNFNTPSPVYIRYSTQYQERRECLEIVKAGGVNE